MSRLFREISEAIMAGQEFNEDIYKIKSQAHSFEFACNYCDDDVSECNPGYHISYIDDLGIPRRENVCFDCLIDLEPDLRNRMTEFKKVPYIFDND